MWKRTLTNQNGVQCNIKIHITVSNDIGTDLHLQVPCVCWSLYAKGSKLG